MHTRLWQSLNRIHFVLSRKNRNDWRKSRGLASVKRRKSMPSSMTSRICAKRRCFWRSTVFLPLMRLRYIISTAADCMILSGRIRISWRMTFPALDLGWQTTLHRRLGLGLMTSTVFEAALSICCSRVRCPGILIFRRDFWQERPRSYWKLMFPMLKNI